MGNQVKFVETTQEGYDSIENKDSGSLYLTSDTKRLYKGTDLVSSSLTPIYDGNTQRFSSWTITRDNVDITSSVSQPAFSNGEWAVENVSGDGTASPISAAETETSLVWTYNDGVDIHQYVAERTINNLKFVLAGQSDKALASDEEVVLLRTKVSTLEQRIAALEAAIGQGLNGTY